jgi:hypothetical protein
MAVTPLQKAWLYNAIASDRLTGVATFAVLAE